MQLSKNFSLKELSCRCCGEYVHDEEFIIRLELFRHLLGDKPLRINSGHRCRLHNVRVGGSAHSQHKHLAVDVSLLGHDARSMWEQSQKSGFLGIGLGGSFIHLDLRRKVESYQPPRKLTVWFYSKEGEKRWKSLLQQQAAVS